MPSQNNPRCCVCASAQQKCSSCDCVRKGIPCRNCKKGVLCLNRPPADQNREREGVRPRDEDAPQDGQQEAAEIDGRLHANTQPPPPVIEQTQAQNANGDLMWKGRTLAAAKEWVDETYLEIVGWSAYNFMDAPKCDATKRIIKEMTILVNNYNQDSPLAAFTLKMLFILPKLFFQKTHRKA